jgi:hypothetical protein
VSTYRDKNFESNCEVVVVGGTLGVSDEVFIIHIVHQSQHKNKQPVWQFAIEGDREAAKRAVSVCVFARAIAAFHGRDLGFAIVTN